MKYVNERFYELMNSMKENQALIEKMKKDVDEFLPSFSDSADNLSRWGHYYFCDDDGGRLIFDVKTPEKHQCEVCGKVYNNDTLDGVWIYMYRNKAVLMALVSAVIYKATKEQKYYDYALKIVEFYASHYDEFLLHNKENLIANSYDTMPWGCGKMMPQGLNESIAAIRFVQIIEILRDDLSLEFINFAHQKMFRKMFFLLAPQATRIHNISCWNLSAIGVMGLAFKDQEMIDFAFTSEFNIRKQLESGVTKDFFWYEGSIHYNFFLLEGISYLFLFSKIYNYDFGKTSSEIFQNMFVQAYNYAFDNHDLPNPNDGWPNLNLRTFSYVYHTVARALGEDSAVGNIVKIIEAAATVRTSLPLAEPYYCDNRICLEQLLFNTDFDYQKFTPQMQQSNNFPKSNFVILRNGKWNAFMKYGLNGKSHAHPDIMNIELMYGDQRISRDLSNAGYRSRLCNEWHRKTLSHNTVCCNGMDITSVSPGECIYYDQNKITAIARDVYEKVDYTRTIQITENSFTDDFLITSEKESIFDYVFHLESSLCLEYDLDLEDAVLGFDQNGYQHILDVKRVKTDQKQVVLHAGVNDINWNIWIDLSDNHELYLLKTKDNPVNKTRNTILLRNIGSTPHYHLKIEAGEATIIK